jgi:hypothetical protein
MNNLLDRVVMEPFDRFIERLLTFLPDIMTAVLVLAAGIVLGFILKSLFLRFFHAIKIDKLSERSGAVEMMKKGGVKEPVSAILARLIGWLTVISFVILSLRSLNMPAVERILERFILYLPNLFIAGVIIFFGYFLSNFLGRAALIAAVNAGFKLSGLMARSVKLTIFLLTATMALEQLGIGRETIIIAFAVIFGGVVFALSLAFGLGGRDIAKDFLEKKIKGEEKKDDINHL